MGKKKIRAVAYPRYSSDNQREESIDAQMRAIEQYCKEKGYILVGSYPDEARSATTDNRPNFQRMIKDSAKGLFDVVVVHKLDRFARDRYDSAHYKRILKRNRVRLESVLERLDNSPESIILESVLEGLAEYYSKNLARESRKGMLENALKGLTTGGRPPYGYKVNPNTKRLEIDERAAEAVRLFFQLIAEGRTKSEIAEELNARGFRTQRGRKFTINSFDGWHCNRKYIGIYTWDVRSAKQEDGKRNNHELKPEGAHVVVPGAVPAIIDPELFERVNKIMADRKFKPAYYKAQAVYLLSDKVFCGKCGARCNGNGYTNKGEHYRYYSCSAKCGNPSIRKEDLERVIIQLLLDQYFNDDAIQKMVEQIQAMYVEQRQTLQRDAEPLKREHAELHRKIHNWIEALGSIADKELLMGYINEAMSRKEAIEVALERLEAMNNRQQLDDAAIVHIFHEKKHQLLHGDDTAKKAIMQEFVDSVIITFDDGTDEFDVNLRVRVTSGGGDGNRTRVRRSRYMHIYGRRPSTDVPATRGRSRWCTGKFAMVSPVPREQRHRLACSSDVTRRAQATRHVTVSRD